MKGFDYPHPCDTCKNPNTQYKDCRAYKARLNAFWKYLNGVYRRLCCYSHNENPEKFRYEHPDVYRRYIERGPCPDCAAKENCQTVCATYWRWWDARMAWFRRRLRV